jgi:DNA-binding CsgD family transcriptional regulator
MKLLVDELFAGRHVLPPIDGRNDAEQIIVDTEIDGVRYLLMRKPKAPRAPVVLSPREHEIVRMVAQGHPNKFIASALNISSWTVSTHLRHIFAKFGVGSRAAMVAKYGALDWRRDGASVRSE